MLVILKMIKMTTAIIMVISLWSSNGDCHYEMLLKTIWMKMVISRVNDDDNHDSDNGHSDHY